MRSQDMGRCVLNSLGECLAKIPEACRCQQMPKTVYEEARAALEGPSMKAAEIFLALTKAPR